ncbi:DUF6518 family protein [Aeromicrobium massiliense]|uniref:DUF6518 family protein n=1 Tax=Aeromicrobium massiliense TaxID=1464554 RepID=UPI0009D9811D|nr:DUF6518 family protein [Aeromicrobium massiliense]
MRLAVRSLSVVLVTGFALGVLTSFGQELLPDEVRSFANSSGSWSLVAFLLALRAPRLGVALVGGAFSLWALLAGYVVASELRGFPASSWLVTFWGAAGLVAGPLLGLAAWWSRYGTATQGGLGAGALAGVLVGEGVYGLTVIGDTTAPEYWWGQVGAGVLVWLTVTWWHRSATTFATGLVTAAGVAAAFLALYERV